MQLQDVAISQPAHEEFVADALKAVQLKFVDSLNDVDDVSGHEPEFAHQHFGEAENIIGYKKLDVTLCISDASLFIYPIIKYEAKIPKGGDLMADDILYKIKDQLPSSQLDILVGNSAQFEEKLHEQKSFTPPGELISKFFVEDEDGEKRTMQFYKVEGCENEAANRFLERAQALAFWYIDAVCYTDYEDPRFFNYFLFESTTAEDGSPKFIFAGYSSLYRFYYYPDMDRVRIAQIMLAPTYRHSGIGTKFLNAIYSDLCAQERVYDITAEAPADAFLFMRDFADCVNCCQLPEFSKTNLSNGFTNEMKETARKKLKLHAAQARRVYEILRFANTNVNSQSEMAAFKADVTKRLERPFLRSKRDFSKLSEALDAGELAVVAHNLNPEQRQPMIEEAFENTIDCYKIVLDRLRKFEGWLIHTGF